MLVAFLCQRLCQTTLLSFVAHGACNSTACNFAERRTKLNQAGVYNRPFCYVRNLRVSQRCLEISTPHRDIQHELDCTPGPSSHFGCLGGCHAMAMEVAETALRNMRECVCVFLFLCIDSCVSFLHAFLGALPLKGRTE